MSESTGVRVELLALFLAVGVGTYLMRAVPLLAALGHLGKGKRRRSEMSPAGSAAAQAHRSGAAESNLMFALRLVAPAVIASLLVSSVLPARSAPAFGRELGVALAALVPTGWAAARWRNLGLTVLVGVASYGALTLIA